MVTMSAFEVLGPIMVGPSSSHTAGALRIALVARSLAPAPIIHVDFVLYNSFSRTHVGHGTDRALVAGILGLAPDDIRVRRSFELARDAGLGFSITEGGRNESLHPNTVEIRMACEGGASISVTGESLGGGRVRVSSINGVRVDIAGDMPTIFVEHRDLPGVLAALTRKLSTANVNIATMSTFREERGGRAYTVFEVDEPVGSRLLELLGATEHVEFASQVNVPGAAGAAEPVESGLSFASGSQLLAACGARQLSIGELMRAREAELAGDVGGSLSPDAAMARVLEVMRSETTEAITRPKASLGGLLGGQAASVAAGGGTGEGGLARALLGSTLTRATAFAMATLERSATMGVIVAAPTAGSAGVVPGALLACAEATGAEDAAIRRALWNAAAVGALISTNATVAGAEGGCQAEVGTASAMAASALVELLGGTPAQCLDAASLAIANTLGLVCDPVGGMVEFPCQARNAMGVACAMSSAQLVLSGVGCPIPFDEVVDAMAAVGAALPATLRETAEGGLAATPTARGGCPGCGACA
ncbi:L-serine dehydratase [Olsenella sp. KH3B4]|uniref:L-serine ammonia-lyase, iron-sulfur-dependent, subunit alpha n=1 Tax=Olsenella sp. KH3B4 TaxID=1855394 RepID=UPI0008D3C858|nr:L-serine ammonia-lyase, iron-sulfur-dependent, subunit alpha [Olsenella sp. KH3B4]SES91174.1 L-serine dehydratase [Olsenella sp. KH3B4]